MGWLIPGLALCLGLGASAGVEESLKSTFSAQVVEVAIAKRSLVERKRVFTYDPKEVRENVAPILSVGLNPRWLVKVRIESVDGNEPLFSKDELVSFVVHSPIQMLGSFGLIDSRTRKYRWAGKTLQFELDVIPARDGRIKFGSLRLVPEKPGAADRDGR